MRWWTAEAAGITDYDRHEFSTEDSFDMGTIDAARPLLWDHEIGIRPVEQSGTEVSMPDKNRVES